MAMPQHKLRFKELMVEVVFVTALGAVFAFAANEISPRGLMLMRNYFPGTTRSSAPAAAAANRTPVPGGNPEAVTTTARQLADQLKNQGLQLVDSNQMVQFFRNPRYQREAIVFVDARDDRHYQAGHIPGAYQFDHYRAENYFASALPACLSADQIVVYCTGGSCEDSAYTALTLRDAGVPKEKLFVYGGGITEWTANGLPVEVGARASGNYLHTKP